MTSRACLAALIIAVSLIPRQDAPRALLATDPQVIARPDAGRALYEPSLAVDPGQPSHWVAAAIDGGRGTTFPQRVATQTCRAVTTFDDGRTFTAHEFQPTECFDPSVVFTPAGTVVVSLLAKPTPQQPDELLVYRSSDGGRSWANPVSLGLHHDHSVMVVDRSGGPGNGWIYVTSHRSTRADNGERRWGPYVARSRDDAKSFDDPVTIVPNNLHNLAEMPVVLSDGMLIVSFVDAGYPTDAREEGSFDRRRAWTVRSSDAGHSFSIPLFVNDACGPPPGYRLSALAADVSAGPFRDRLYFACRERGGGPILVSASADRGGTWSASVAPLRNPEAAPDRIPGIAVNAQGTVLAAWIEGWSGAGRTCEERLTASASVDGGSTFDGVKEISRVPPCADDAFVASTTGGDYFGLAPLPDNGFRIVWSETPGGESRLMTATVHVH